MNNEHGAFNEGAFDAMISAANELADAGGSSEDIGTVLTTQLESKLVDWFKTEMTEAKEFIDSLLDMEDIDPEHVQKLIGTAGSDQMLAVAMTLYIDSMVK